MGVDVGAFLTALLFVGGAIAYAVIGVLVGRRYNHGRVREGHNDVLVPLFLTAGVIYAVLLGFMVVAVWESYDAAHANAAEEAATLVPLYRTTYDMAPEKGAGMRKLLRAYAETVVNDEWDSIRETGHASEKARKISGDVLRLYGTLSPSTKIKEIVDAQFLATYSQVLVDRNKRLLQASEQLSWIMWFGVIAGAIIVIGMSFALFMERAVLQVAMTGVMAALIGTSLFMMNVLNRPFVGPVAIEPAPFESTLKIFDDVDRGN